MTFQAAIISVLKSYLQKIIDEGAPKIGHSDNRIQLTEYAIKNISKIIISFKNNGFTDNFHINNSHLNLNIDINGCNTIRVEYTEWNSDTIFPNGDSGKYPFVAINMDKRLSSKINIDFYTESLTTTLYGYVFA
jgi:hypothetical protein